MTEQPQERNRWDATLYDGSHSFVWKLGEGVVELLQPQPGERILDVGCGTGHLTALLAGRGADVLGIDAAPAMVSGARASYPELRFEVADIREFETATPFDAVFSNATLHWVRPPEQAVARIHAALRPGGRFVAEFGGKGNVEAITVAVLEALQGAGFPPAPEAFNYYPSLGEYALLLEARGFRVTCAVHFDRPTPLEGGESGLRNWLGMFGGRFLEGVPADRRAGVVSEIEERLRGALWRDGRWWADYVRLRVMAVKPGAAGGAP